MRLDPELDSNGMTGPSRDLHKQYGQEISWRNEPHAIEPGHAPYSMKTNPRPKTSERPHYDLVPGRLPVLVRNSNINPAAEGVGDVTSEWSVSDQLLAPTDPGYQAPLGAINTKTVGIGLLLGLVAYKMLG